VAIFFFQKKMESDMWHTIDNINYYYYFFSKNDLIETLFESEDVIDIFLTAIPNWHTLLKWVSFE